MSYSEPLSEEEGGTDELIYSDLFSYVSAEQSPFVDPDHPGIRLSADNLRIAQNRFYMDLHVSFRFENSYFSCFKDLHDSVVLLFEQPSLNNLSQQQSLSDPHKDYEDYEEDNFDASRRQELDGSTCLYCNIALTHPLNLDATGEQLYVRAVLAEHTSNTLAFALGEDAETVSVTSYIEGEPHEVLTEEEFMKSLTML